ncbi:MAG TPA: lysophospholipid acyltransferase family protein [Caulobacteraceae bacterium]|nr:lysophospholipid acyltransferase family protein [Caulobacteraceae bacterium]
MIWVRSLLFAAIFYAVSTIAAIAMAPLLLGPRRWIIVTIGVWARVVMVFLRLICGVKVEVRGRQFMPTGPALVAAKHQGMFDTIAPFTFLPDAAYVLKKELLIIPFYGWYSIKGGMIAVDRAGHAAALKKLVKDTRERMAEDRQVVIFPEGTRKAPGAAPDYKPGIAALYRDLGLPCTPVATNSGAHWPAHGFLRRPGTVVFEFLEPIPAGLKRGEFMKELQARIETATDALLAEGL